MKIQEACTTQTTGQQELHPGRARSLVRPASSYQLSRDKRVCAAAYLTRKVMETARTSSPHSEERTKSWLPSLLTEILLYP